jgi:hypothetical protein
LFFMSDTTATLAAFSDPAASAGRAEALRDRQLQMLGELAEIGLELARAVEAEAKGGELGLDAAILAYARVSRAVRQSIMLQSRLLDGTLAEGKAAEAPGARRAEVRARVSRILDRAVEASNEAPERVERLRAEAAERLESERFGDLLERPVVDIVADICNDLGLSPDWMALHADINAAEAVRWGDSDDPGELGVVWLPPAPAPRDSS